MTRTDSLRVVIAFMLAAPIAAQDRVNFNLRFALELPGSPVIGDTSIFAALPEQLGLKVEPRREAVNVLIIDGIERPSVD